jgi:hypothetical protein
MLARNEPLPLWAKMTAAADGVNRFDAGAIYFQGG